MGGGLALCPRYMCVIFKTVSCLSPYCPKLSLNPIQMRVVKFWEYCIYFKLMCSKNFHQSTGRHVFTVSYQRHTMYIYMLNYDF